MRGLIIILATVAIFVLLLPFFVGLTLIVACVVVFFALAAAVASLLVHFGVLPRGGAYRTFTYRRRSGERPHYRGETRADAPAPGGWQEGEQEGDVVTLPPEALKKDGDK